MVLLRLVNANFKYIQTEIITEVVKKRIYTVFKTISLVVLYKLSMTVNKTKLAKGGEVGEVTGKKTYLACLTV